MEECTSEKGNALDIPTNNSEPKCLRKFSWGAFAFTWLWGIANRLWWTLGITALVISASLSLAIALNDDEYFGFETTILIIAVVPSLIYSILLGIGGNRFAWEKYKKLHKATTDSDIMEFNRKQKRWNIAGFVFLGIEILRVISIFLK